MDVPIGDGLVGHLVVSELGVLHAFGQLAGVLRLDQVQVVDPSRRRLERCRVVGSGFGVHVPADDVRNRVAHAAAVPAHLDASEVERVEHELDLAADQDGVDFVGVPVQPDGARLRDGPSF